MEYQIDSEGARRAHEPTSDKNEQEKQGMWNALRSELKVGTSLTGKIFYKAPYGVHLDVGLSFPALLRIVHMIDLNYDEYLNDCTYKLGQEIELTYIWMGDRPDKIDVQESGYRVGELQEN